MEDKIIPYNLGVSNDYKKQTLLIHERTSRSGLFKYLDDGDQILKHSVRLIPFKEILSESIDIIKIDCEGCEYEVLENLLNHDLIGKIREGIVLEIHNINDKYNYNYGLTLLKRIGFRNVKYEAINKFIGIITAKK